MADPQIQIQLLRSTVVDGRLGNVRHRQNEFHRFHSVLTENAAQICRTICLDDPRTLAQAEMEFFLAMDSIRQAYDTLNFEASLREEYLVKSGKGNTTRRTRLGIVAVRPQDHSKFYSTIGPIAAAIAAGNCVLLELEDSASKLSALLRTMLPKALDGDVFAVATSLLQPSHIAEVDLLVDQQSAFSSRATLPPASPGSTSFRSIAIVDRTANVDKAAKDIFESRKPGNCGSPYAPDLVLINDFLVEGFVDLVMRLSNDGTAVPMHPCTPESEFQVAFAKAEGAGDVKVHCGQQVSVVEIRTPSCAVATTRVEGPFVVILPITSMVSAVLSQRSCNPAHATYVYADLAAAKVLTEQIPSRASYVNQIPQHLLFGPVAYPHTLHPRYSPRMFSTASPQLVNTPASLPPSSSPGKVMELATTPLKPTGQRPGHAIGFFEQGILIGLSLSAFVVLPGICWAAWSAARRSYTLLWR